MSFETDLKKLEEIVEDLSSGEKTLDAALELYKAGLTLTKKCHDYLKGVEKEVKAITKKNGKVEESNFAA
ncbi:exodeoxyribonuclease VII small subunit [Candidatus Termititenax aidoneus]|uniref:Exodeoxyribonuclease 7 small subunit n=1 Tax=Termititenax aidoneus TaxID=2218524 RepID=A0A388TA64_TERA1|nr:exodeoxyribonuclease VII small subunit [Candidatus Termititenax aidoneus]